MKPVLQAVLFLGLVTPSFSAAPVVDFDGKNKKSETENNSAPALSAVVINQDIKIPGAQYKVEAKASVGIMVLADSGEWVPAELKVEKDSSYFKTTPGSEYIVFWSCRGDTTSAWSFSSTSSMQPWKKGDSPGHSHVQGMPLITYTSGAPLPNPISANNLRPNVDYKVDLKAFDFSTSIIWKSNFGGACNGQSHSLIVDIKEEGLSPMPAGADANGYLLGPVANNAAHPDIHNVTSGFGQALIKMGSVWRNTCPSSKSLTYQRMSLRWGGVFDRDLDWKEPYYGHNKGIAVDISKKLVLKGDRQGMINLMCNQGYKVYSEQDLTDDHYHVTLRNGGGNVNWAGATACCIKESGVYPSPAACLNLASKDLEPASDRDTCPYLPTDQDIKSDLQ